MSAGRSYNGGWFKPEVKPEFLSTRTVRVSLLNQYDAQVNQHSRDIQTRCNLVKRLFNSRVVVDENNYNVLETTLGELFCRYYQGEHVNEILDSKDRVIEKLRDEIDGLRGELNSYKRSPYLVHMVILAAVEECRTAERVAANEHANPVVVVLAKVSAYVTLARKVLDLYK